MKICYCLINVKFKEKYVNIFYIDYDIWFKEQEMFEVFFLFCYYQWGIEKVKNWGWFNDC